MADKKKLTLGVLPTRRDLSGEFFCNIDVALRRKRETEEKLRSMGIDFINIDFLNKEGLIINGLDAAKAAEYFRSKGVDAVFAPHLNFGCEDAIAKTAKLVNKPILLWGPRDDAPDAGGNRCTDSQCGLFATGKVLRDFGIPFTYMTNCRLQDPVFEKTLNNFLAAAQVVKSFRGMRIGQISVRPETFWSVKCNELQLLERFGIEIVPVTLIEIQNLYNDIIKNHRNELAGRVAYYKQNFSIAVDEEFLYRTAAMYNAIHKWAVDLEVDGIASSCWGPFRQLADIASCFTFSELTENKIPTVCETDIHGAVTSVMAQAATRWQKASFLADITVRHPANDNAELFWHCGVFPRSTSDPEAKPAIAKNFDEDRPTVGNFRISDGQVTISRFDCSGDKYQLLTATGKVVDGPATTGTYGWIEFKDWPLIEHKVAAGPYIHHCVGIYADISPVLYEACRYIPGLAADPVDPSAGEIEAYLR
jgi:L-fucose isomerase-like protein